MVTILNSNTREEEKRSINEIASSHLARRTFIGKFYKRVKDPNLVGSLSGNKEAAEPSFDTARLTKSSRKNSSACSTDLSFPSP